MLLFITKNNYGGTALCCGGSYTQSCQVALMTFLEVLLSEARRSQLGEGKSENVLNSEF